MDNKFVRFFGELLDVAERHPVELLIVVMCYVLSRIHGLFGVGEENFFMAAPLLFTFSFMLRLLFGGGRMRIIYLLSPLAVVPFLFVDVAHWEPTYVIVSLLITLLSFFVVGMRRDNREFAVNAVSFVSSVVISVILSGIVFLLLMAIYYSMIYVFDLSDSHRFVEQIAVAVYMMLAPLLFLLFLPARYSESYGSSRIGNIVSNYIFTPALVLYLLVLYAYFIKITFFGIWPQGGVAVMVLVFMIIAFVVKAFRQLQSEKMLSWFYDKFSYLSLPAVIMFWAGVWYRIYEYGFTQMRVYLILAGLVMTVSVVMFMFRGRGRYLYIPVMLIGLAAIFTYIPGISAKDIGTRYTWDNSDPSDDAESVSKYRDGVYPPLSNVPIEGYSTYHSTNLSDGYEEMLGDGRLIILVAGDTIINQRHDEMLRSMLLRVTERPDTVSFGYVSANSELLQYCDVGRYRLVFNTWNLYPDSILREPVPSLSFMLEKKSE